MKRTKAKKAFHVLDGVDSADSDPFMMWVTPIVQYNFQYTVGTAESATTLPYRQVYSSFYIISLPEYTTLIFAHQKPSIKQFN